MTTRPRVGYLTAASSLAIASPGYFSSGIAATGPVLIAAFSLSKSAFGFVLFAQGMVAALTSPLLGTLTDRVGGVRLLRWAFGLGVGVAVGLALSPGFAVFFVASMLAGLTASAANPATNTLVNNHVPFHRRGKVIGMKQAGGPLGIAAAGALTPPVAAAWGWRWAMLTTACIPAIALVLLWMSRVSAGPIRPGRDRTVARPPLGFRIWTLTVNALAIGWGTGALIGFIAVFGVEGVGLSETTAGAMLTIMGLVGVVARLAWGAVADRTHHSDRLLAIMGALAVVAAVGAWSAGRFGVWMLAFSTVLVGAGAISWNSVAMFAVIKEASAERAGAASGVVVAGYMIGYSAGPWAFGALVDTTGGYGASLGMVVAAFAVSIAALAIRPRGARG
ncbi:MAG TPA: MFS transporter [Acidimicrobiia bacterium]|nr:MFS transporter [Acidimicrobiia bacterium]